MEVVRVAGPLVLLDVSRVNTAYRVDRSPPPDRVGDRAWPSPSPAAGRRCRRPGGRAVALARRTITVSRVRVGRAGPTTILPSAVRCPAVSPVTFPGGVCPAAGRRCQGWPGRWCCRTCSGEHRIRVDRVRLRPVSVTALAVAEPSGTSVPSVGVARADRPARRTITVSAVRVAGWSTTTRYCRRYAARPSAQ